MSMMRMLTTEGVVDLYVDNIDSASLIGQHWNAVQRALEGDPSELEEFEDWTIRGHAFMTDPDQIERLARIGELDIEDIYEDSW